jgi:hypothetical protein
VDNRILDKIKRLLALARSSSNQHEAANALHMAQQLMKKHQLSDTDIALHDITERYTKRANAADKQPRWSLLLAHTVGTAFGLRYFVSWHRDVGNSIVFVGPKDRVEIGTYCYEVLAPQLVKARKSFFGTLNKRLKPASKTNRADLFAEGWVMAVLHKIEALVPTEDEQNLVQLYMEKHHPDLTNAAVRAAKQKVRDMSGYIEGSAQGRNVTLNAGVAGAAQGQLNHK